jgi:hypothetical protein
MEAMTGMKHYYQTELEESVERFRATMAASQGPIDTRPRLERKGKTLLVKRGTMDEWNAALRGSRFAN